MHRDFVLRLAFSVGLLPSARDLADLERFKLEPPQIGFKTESPLTNISNLASSVTTLFVPGNGYSSYNPDTYKLNNELMLRGVAPEPMSAIENRQRWNGLGLLR